jgi:hypothetical protein
MLQQFAYPRLYHVSHLKYVAMRHAVAAIRRELADIQDYKAVLMLTLPIAVSEKR